MEASAQTKREAAEKVEAEREAKSEVAAKPESGISDGPSFTDGIRRK